MKKYTQIPDKEYHAIDLLSQSKLKFLIENNYKQYLEESNKKYDTDAMRFGSAAHSLMLENVDLEETYLILDRVDGRSKAGKDQKKEMGDRPCLYRDEHKSLLEMYANFKESKEVKNIMSKAALIEHYAIASIHNDRFPDRSFQMKFKPDIVGVDFIADYKTIGSYASDENIKKAMRNYHYPFQAAAYLSLDKIITGQEKKTYYWIFQESISPYGCRVVEIDEKTLRSGYEKLDIALIKYIDGLNYPEKQTANYKGITTISLSFY